jgi:hypothetical protein
MFPIIYRRHSIMNIEQYQFGYQQTRPTSPSVSGPQHSWPSPTLAKGLQWADILGMGSIFCPPLSPV